MHDDLRSFLGKADFSRREFVVTTLATGFALAVQPVSAETITTDTKGLEAGEVKIPTPDGQMPGYRAMPEGNGPFPTVLVVQEIFGVHEHIKDLCRRLAKAGYFAVAPELYARQGDVSKLTDIQEIISKVVAKVPDAQVLGDLDATVAWAKKTGKANIDKLAITGFCWGGRIVWLYAAHNPKLKAGVAWYGRLVGRQRPAAPQAARRAGRQPQGPRAGPLWRSRHGYSGRLDRQDARGAESLAAVDRDHRLSRHASRFQCRLPADISQKRSRGRLEAHARLVQKVWRRLNPWRARRHS